MVHLVVVLGLFRAGIYLCIFANADNEVPAARFEVDVTFAPSRLRPYRTISGKPEDFAFTAP
jgi:hypothetical protein